MSELESYVRELWTRQQVWECLLRYTRGVDRLDRELLLAGFHGDACIDQGSFKGGREAYADWVLGYHRENQLQTQHLMTNHSCELDRDMEVAHCETYIAYFGSNPVEDESFAIGRYIDRLESFSGEWLITDRVCTTEGTSDLKKNGLLAQITIPKGSLAAPQRDRSDPSYIRPLHISRETNE